MLAKANETITYATRHGVIYRIDIYKADNSEIEFVYIGSTKNYKRRMANHNAGSSNPEVKQFIDAGRKAIYNIVEEVAYF
jgi:hypothetical protein